MSDILIVGLTPLIGLICTISFIISSHILYAKKKLLTGAEKKVEALSLQMNTFEREMKKLYYPEFKQATISQPLGRLFQNLAGQDSSW